MVRRLVVALALVAAAAGCAPMARATGGRGPKATSSTLPPANSEPPTTAAPPPTIVVTTTTPVSK
jgi:hypothetical protein